jgi:hypothetical protein
VNAAEYDVCVTLASTHLLVYAADVRSGGFQGLFPEDPGASFRGSTLGVVRDYGRVRGTVVLLGNDIS